MIKYSFILYESWAYLHPLALANQTTRTMHITSSTGINTYITIVRVSVKKQETSKCSSVVTRDTSNDDEMNVANS